MAAGSGPLPGNAVFTTRIEDMRDRSMDMQPLWPAMVTSFYQLESNIFDEEGPGWAPLAESTLSVKASLGYSGALIEERTDMLRSSLTGLGYGTTTVTPMGWEVVSNVAYAGYQQYGFLHKGGVQVPARALVDIETNVDVVAIWFGMIETYLVGGGTRSPGNAGLVGVPKYAWTG